MSLKHIVASTLPLIALGLAAAGCGAGATSTSSATTRTVVSTAAPGAAGNPSGFAWLRPAPPPTDWTTVRLPGTMALAYPSSWSRIHSDPGTASAALEQSGTGLVSEYLNATPQQGPETLQNWAHFRPDHNQDEGDRHEQVLSSAEGLRFRNGTGSCVIDRYRTSRTSYEEIACLVRGSHGASVIVAAALTAHWAHSAPTLERAVSAFLA
ncbi:MAG: hypothetical protein JO027_16530 [Solirubrobacterales bacterium]|nr:hypothetical protein [Solirubrobacterales bacterium]